MEHVAKKGAQLYRQEMATAVPHSISARPHDGSPTGTL